MNKKEIENWKIQVANGKNIFVAHKVNTIHPVMDSLVRHLFKIDVIQYIRLTQTDIQASSEIAVQGNMKIPISKPGHPSAIGVHLIVQFEFNSIQFYEINSAVKGYGERLVQAVLEAIPESWEVIIVMDWSRGFWDRMAEKYKNIEVIS